MQWGSGKAGSSPRIGGNDLAIEEKGKVEQNFKTPNNNTHNVTLLAPSQHVSSPSSNVLLRNEPTPTNRTQAPTTIRRSRPRRPKQWKRTLSKVGQGLKNFFWKKSFGVGFAGGAAGAIGLGVATGLGAKIGGAVGAAVGGILAGGASFGLAAPGGVVVGYAVGAAVGIGIAAAVGAIGRGLAAALPNPRQIRSKYRNRKINKIANDYERQIPKLAHPKNNNTWLGKQFAAFADQPLVQMADQLQLYQASFTVDKNRSDFLVKANVFFQEAIRTENKKDWTGKSRTEYVHNVAGQHKTKCREALNGQLNDDEIERLVGDIAAEQKNMINDAAHKSAFVSFARSNA